MSVARGKIRRSARAGCPRRPLASLHMPRRKSRPASVLLTVGMLLACAAAAAASTAVRSGGGAQPVSGIAVLRLGSSASAGAQHLRRYAYVILGKGEYKYGRQTKRSSPRTKVLAYEAAMDLNDDCAPATWLCPAVTYQQALAHDGRHPKDPWILRDRSGRSLVNPSYPHTHLANVGSVSFQQTWVKRVAAAAAKGGFDGVMVDNVLGLVSGWTRGQYPTIYPTDAAWERAMTRFVRSVGPALKRRGLYIVISTFKGGSDDGSADVAFWKRLAPYVNGLMAEYWEQSPIDLQPFDNNPSYWTGHWAGWLRLADAAQAAGAHFFPLQHGSPGDARTMTYGKASFLLVWNGSGGGYIFSPESGADPWNPAWTTPIGKPVGRRYRVGVGWRRKFTRGTVVVNPDPKRTQVFPLRGRYVGADGAQVRSVALAPVTAMVLRRVR